MSTLDAATQQIFHDPVHRRAWVIYQLSLQKRSLASLSRDHGNTRRTASLALDRPYPRMERAIAEAVGVPVHLLFPERYTPTGERRIRMGRPKKSVPKTGKNTTRMGAGNTQTGTTE